MLLSVVYMGISGAPERDRENCIHLSKLSSVENGANSIFERLNASPMVFEINKFLKKEISYLSEGPLPGAPPLYHPYLAFPMKHSPPVADLIHSSPKLSQS